MARKFTNIRDFINFLEQKNDLVRVKETVDPDLEINAIIDRLARTDGPAVVFESVKGSQMPVLGNVYSAYRRLQWMLGTDDIDGCMKAGVDKLTRFKQGEENAVRPVTVDRDQARCKE